MIAFRFANGIFNPIWNKDYIEKVEISMFGTSGIDGRGAFYDSVGALRDVGQNHVLQMLAFIAMEDPLELDATLIRAARASVLKALCLFTKDTFSHAVVRGQYAGYKDVSGVEKDSQTETYFKIEALIDNPRWQGVPFYLESGQGMHEDKTEIKIYFKKTETCLCPPEAEHHHQNILTFRIQPDERISILFWAKKPGLTLDLEPKELSFSYRAVAGLTDAYEKVLFDGIAGDQLLFMSTEEIFAAWNFITPILELWKDLPLHQYKKGSAGPDVELLSKT